ncbi:ABC transporter ATP-binding protein [Serratia rubidaea]|uniref:ABC transporter ATP-binding protein n=1 Tax=Serratia rubidaea TaxID=61652 RepID=UPI0022B8CF28|nr:ABC transporter ATP-binding protein [Serratia rubidaea]WBF45269.1 ABC transporter ATP-binding protein/permease [Serratia rubidaea]
MTPVIAPERRVDGSPLGQMVRQLLPYLRQQKTLAVGGVLAMLAEVALRVVEPWPVKYVIDALSVSLGAQLDNNMAPATLRLLLICGACALALAMLRAMASFLTTLAFALTGSRIATRLRADLYQHVQRLSVQYHRTTAQGDLVQRLVADIGRLQEVAVTAGLPLTGNLLTLIAMTGMMLWLNPPLALWVVGCAAAFVLATRYSAPKITAAARKTRKQEGALASLAHETLGAIAVVQAYGLESAFSRRFASANQKSLTEGVRARRLAAALERATDVLVALAVGAVLFFGGLQVLRGHMTPGDLVLFLTYMKTTMKPLRDVAKYSGRIARAAASGERVMQVLRQQPAMRDAANAQPCPEPVRGELHFVDVWSSYGEVPVLKGVGLHIRAGEHVALVGASGAGKSSLASLLMRLQDPCRGEVRLDGRPLRSMTLASLRAQVAVVHQEPVLFAMSIRDNIRMGNLDADDAAIVTAARQADALAFIQALPAGFDTVLGERGETLSGGQRQRIAIARALLRDAALVVLDEVTSGLDRRAAQAVLNSLDQLIRARTTLVITHDFDTAMRCDRIIWLEDGRVVESGLRDVLLAGGGRFARWRADRARTHAPIGGQR